MIGFDPIFTQDDDPESNLEELEDDYNDIFDPFGSCKPNSEEAMTNRELHKLLQSLAVTGASTLTGFTQTECSTDRVFYTNQFVIGRCCFSQR